jgi:hypothetical protein
LVNNPRDYLASKLWLFILFSLCFAILAGSFLLDDAVARFTTKMRTPGVTAAMNTMTEFGDVTVLVWIVACVYVIGLGSSRTGGKPTAILAALALGTTGLCVLVLKLLTARGADGEFHFFWGWYPGAMMD